MHRLKHSKRMFYGEAKPSRRLSSFIKCYWVLVNNLEEVQGTPEVIMPDGCPEIIFNLAEPFKRHRADRVEIQPKAIVVGQMKGRVLVEPTRNVSLFGVRFDPSGLYPFVKQSIADLTDEIETVDTVFGRLGSELTERIRGARSINERIVIFENSLIGLLKVRKNECLSARVAEVIHRNDGKIRIERLAETLDINWKTLERRFKKEVGITPKLFCRITRLQKILHLLNRERLTPWADIAYSFGYADQAHFINDFRQFSGVSPKTFISKENKISDSFVG